MLSSYDSLARAVLLRCPLASYLLARQWVSFAFREVAEKRAWSWLIKEGQFLLPAVYSTGTVTVTNASTTVTGASTVFTAGMVGRQFRAGANNPIYTVATYVSGTEITLDQPWGGADTSGLGYEIFRAYVNVPTDFHAFMAVWDPRQGWRLNFNSTTQEDLNALDPQRSNAGQPWLLAFRDYDPLSISTPPVARYEVWPHVKSSYVIPYIYEVRATDLEDSGASLPRHIRGDMLLEMALAKCALWPGPEGRKNPYFNMGLADRHTGAANVMLMDAMRQDEEVFMQNVQYQHVLGMPPAPDAAWAQKHAMSI